MAQVIIAGSIYRRPKEEAERRGAAVDEVAVELLERALGASLDPLERAEFHRGLAEKFLREAEELLARGTTSKPPKRRGAPPPRWSKQQPPRKEKS